MSRRLSERLSDLVRRIYPAADGIGLGEGLAYRFSTLHPFFRASDLTYGMLRRSAGVPEAAILLAIGEGMLGSHGRRDEANKRWQD
jgi:hypothetical protein